MAICAIVNKHQWDYGLIGHVYNNTGIIKFLAKALSLSYQNRFGPTKNLESVGLNLGFMQAK